MENEKQPEKSDEQEKPFIPHYFPVQFAREMTKILAPSDERLKKEKEAKEKKEIGNDQ